MITNTDLQWDVSGAVDHAISEFPMESCGAIIDGEYRPFDNTAEHSDKDFRIDDPDYSAAYASGRVDAVVHSHNNGPWASMMDQQQQRQTDVPWGIINLRGGSPTHAVFWGPGIQPEPLEGRQFFHGVWDCWGLARDYLVGAYDLDDAPDPPRDREFWLSGEKLFEEYLGGPFDSADPHDAVVGDVCLYSIGKCRYLNHCGVYMGRGKILHHFENRVSRCYPSSFHGQYLEHVLRYNNDSNLWKTCQAV